MLIRSRGVWISSRSGPMDTQSKPGIFPASRPHSTPAWMASTLGSRPYCSRNTWTIRSRRSESSLYSQAG